MKPLRSLRPLPARTNRLRSAGRQSSTSRWSTSLARSAESASTIRSARLRNPSSVVGHAAITARRLVIGGHLGQRLRCTHLETAPRVLSHHAGLDGPAKEIPQRAVRLMLPGWAEPAFLQVSKETAHRERGRGRHLREEPSEPPGVAAQPSRSSRAPIRSSATSRARGGGHEDNADRQVRTYSPSHTDVSDVLDGSD
jgi:hypothetical protein